MQENVVFNKSCESMADIDDKVISTCVTSPPYFGLREYGHDGQIGLEDTIHEYVDRIVRVFQEIRRVLRDDGTIWVNLGDTWAGGGGGNYGNGISVKSAPGQHLTSVRTKKSWLTANNVKAKDQMLVPHTVAMALREDGWYLRDTIVWNKSQCMPSSVRDRTTNAHEYIFLLSKNPHYYYDQDAIRESYQEPSAEESENIAFDGFDVDNDYRPRQKPAGITWADRKAAGAPTRHGLNGVSESMPLSKKKGDDGFTGANARSVWTIPTARYAGNHYAVMPREIARRCILAGSPPGGIVLDPFAGTGTTLEVAVGCGRKYIGYEINKEYCDQIVHRLGLFSQEAITQKTFTP